MIYIIGIIFIVIILIFFHDCFCDFTELIFFIIVSFIIFGVILVLLNALSFVFSKKAETYEKKQYDIQGLENNIITNQETNGAFILGFGYIDSETKENITYYYFKVDKLGKKLETINIDNYSETYIRETNDIKPCLIYVYEKYENVGVFKFLLGKKEYESKVAEVLVVPENTIKIEYNVEV